MTAIKNRYEFVFFFEVENGNPNGDPDAGNMPRIDPETSNGLVTDVCIKRKIRNYTDLVKGGTRKDNLDLVAQGLNSYDIYVREGNVLNDENKVAYDTLKINLSKKGKGKEEGVEALKKDEYKALTKFMCQLFFDVRAFGAVMTTEINCGQVRGPVQLSFGKSIDPIVPQDITITRMAVTNAKDASKERTMGRKHIVPYALYRMEGFISASLAQKTGFSEEDLELLWDAVINMFDHDHSAARGKMATRKLIVFKHDSELGNAPAYQLFERVTAVRKDMSSPARIFSDYAIGINREDMPTGVSIIEK